MDPITKGNDWIHVVTVTPTSGQVAADVTTALTGATVSARLVQKNGTLVVAASAVVTSASDRTVTITLTDTQTATLSARRHYWDVEITTTGGLIFPIELGSVAVREYGGAGL